MTKRILVNREFAGPVRVEVDDEQVLSGRPALVRIHEGDNLIVEIVVKAERQKGADGKWYNAASFLPLYPGVLPKEKKEEVLG